MKNKKLLAIALCVVVIITQFAMLGVSAESKDFLKGVNIHPSANYGGQYLSTYTAIKEAEALGSNIIRIDGSPANVSEMAYYKSVGDIAEENNMQVMLVNAGGFFNFLQISDAESGTTRFRTVDELNIEAITTYYKELATELKGKIEYYQLGNEMDVDFYKGGASDHGATYGSKYYDVTAAAVALETAKNAIKSVDPDAKVGVNFVYYHRGFIHGLKSVDCDSTTAGVQKLVLDYIGMDFYSDMIDSGLFSSNDYTDNIEDLAQYEEPIIVCEANIVATGWNSNDNTDITYNEDANWLTDFYNYCYNSDDVVGFIAYELYDQPARALDQDGNPKFDKEAFYGLIDKDGNKKETYTALQQLYGGTGVAKRAMAESAPQMNNVGEIVTDFAEPIYTGAITVAYNLESAIIEKATTIDLTQGDFIEFDLYVEDASALKFAMANLDLDFKVSFFDDSEGYKDCWYLSEDYISNDGWNHISINKTAFFNGTVDWSAVKSFTLGFKGSDSIIKNQAPISGMNIAFANICTTNLAMLENNADKTRTVIDTDGFEGVFNRQLKYFVGYYGKTLDPVPWISDNDYIEFDLYVQDINIFRAETEKHELVLALLGDSSGTKRAEYNLSKYVKNTGWNHITIKISEMDSQVGTYNYAVKSYRLRLKGSSETESPLYPATFIALKNFNAINKEYGIAPDVELEGAAPLALYEGKWLSGTWGANGFDNGIRFDAVNLSEYQYIEFDFYVENYENFQKYETTGYLPSFISGSNYDTQRAHWTLKNYVTKSGWNHVKVALNKIDSTTGTVNWASTNFIRLRYNVSGNAYANEHYSIANIYATKAVYEVAPEVELEGVAPVALYEGKLYSGTWGSNGFDNGIRFNAVDLSAYQYIEFDFYVEDYENFQKYETTGYLPSFISGSDYNTQRAHWTLKNYVTKSGWNHVKVKLNNIDSTTGTVNWGNTNFVRLRYNVSNNAYANEHYAIANIYATVGYVQSVDIMKDRIDIIGAEVKDIPLDSDGFYTADLVADISNTKMIELDVFITDATFTELEVELADGADNIAIYNFKNLKPGWNHLAMRLSDGVDEDGNAVTITDLASYAFYGEPDSIIYVSNFYAADYVKGDGNRDGLLDIRDLVAMKKNSVGMTLASGMVGNKVAMDVAGNDYNVNALDLSELRRYFLTDKWSVN